MEENMNNQIENATSIEGETKIEETKTQEAPKQTLSTKMIAIIAVAAIIIVAILAFAMGGNNAGSTNGDSVKEAQFESANSAYNDIVSASEICIDIMDSIYGAWHFAIYKSDDYYGVNGIEEFADATNLSYSDVTKALSDVLGFSNPSASYALLEDFNYAIYIVEEVYKSKGLYTQAENLLASAKESLKSVTSEYSDYTGYPTLKSFYSEVSSYLEFAESPSGSFSQLKTTIDNYETKIRTCKNDLAFIFE